MPTRAERNRRPTTRRDELIALRQAVEMAGLRFPFVRGQHYPLRDIEEFEAALTALRQQQPTLNKALRVEAACPWLKVRNNELIPLGYFAEHKELRDDVTFCLMPEGSDVDVIIEDEGVPTRLQITTAGPMWRRQEGESRDWGYDQHLAMHKLNSTGFVSGFGPFEDRNGEITNREEALPTEEIATALVEGLTTSLEKKAHMRTSGCELLVYVEKARNLQREPFLEAVARATSAVRLANFTQVHVFGGEPGYYRVLR